MPTISESPEQKARRKRGPNKLSANTVNAELRTMYMTTLNFVGGVKYLTWLAKKHPSVFMQGLSKYMKADDSGSVEGLQIIVQQLNVVAAPTEGVQNSPVLGDVMPALKLAVNNVAMLVDATDTEANGDG